MSVELAKVLIAALNDFVEAQGGDEKPTRGRGRSKKSEEDEDEKPTRGRRGRAKKTEEPDPRDELKALADKFKKEFSAKELKELLEDVAEVTTVAKVEDEDVAEVIEELKAELEEGAGGEGEDGDGEEITQEAVKVACQAFSKKNGKDEMEDIFSDYGIKTVRSLGKLDQEQLEDLYADVTDL